MLTSQRIIPFITGGLLLFAGTAFADGYHDRWSDELENGNSRFSYENRQESRERQQDRFMFKDQDRDLVTVKTKLSLDDRQFSRFVSIRQDYRREIRNLQQEIALLREKRREEALRHRPDHRKIARLGIMIDERQEKIERYRAQYLRKYRDVCSSHQRDRFDRISRVNSPEMMILFNY
jgi:hypothetical protein